MWIADTEGFSVLAVVLAMFSIYAVCGFLVGEACVASVDSGNEIARARRGLIGASVLTLGLLTSIALTALLGANGSNSAAIIAPFLATAGVGAIRRIRGRQPDSVD